MTSRQPSLSLSSNPARPDFEESMTVLCEGLKQFHNNKTNNNFLDQLNVLRLQVEDSFVDAIDSNSTLVVYRQNKLAHHFLEVITTNDIESKILKEISSSSSSSRNS